MSKASAIRSARRRISALVGLIEGLDSVRVGIHSDLRKLRRLSSEVDDLSSVIDWSRIFQCSEYILRIPEKSPRYAKLRRLEKLSSHLLLASFAGLIVSILLTYIISGLQVSFYSLFVVLVLTNIAYVLRFYVSNSIGKIYTERIKELEEYGKPIREAINKLIARLRAELKRIGHNPRGFKLRLKLIDYRGIEVVKKPSLLRGEYIVVLADKRRA